MTLRTGMGIWGSRYLSPKLAAEAAQGIEGLGRGAVDQFVLWDQLTNWWPQALWEPAVTPLAEMIPDLDSLQDPFTTAAFALSGVSDLGFAVCTDAIRREPAELAQTMLTLSMATTGPATLCLGAGEVRHIAPFGRKRSIGLNRLEEALQILRLLLTERGLVNFDGEIWKLRDAWLGNAGKDHRPEIIAMGGGPRLTEMALRYADGFATGAPFVYADPQQYGETVRELRGKLSGYGRDPDAYTFGLHHIVFLCEDREEFERYVDNPLMKWYSATGGRINQNDWDAEGIEPVLPRDWHYAFHMKPAAMSRADVDEIIDRVTPEMVRKTFFYGTPEEIAARIRPYAASGCDLNLIADLSPLMVPIEPKVWLERYTEICRLVKTG
jgi:phthiodiolone/phenolphthiodiolone dimycocerosates ketoreductase